MMLAVLAPKRHAIRLARRCYSGVESSRLRWLLDTAVVRWAKERVTSTPGEEVVAIMRELQRAGVAAWVAGGWGVDALVGAQTRRHYDVDIVIEDRADTRAAARRTLAGRGYRERETQYNEGLAMPLRLVWCDDDGHSVELLPVALGAAPFHRGDQESFATGSIGDAAVPCLSTALQLELHEGYPPRAVERHDLPLLHGGSNIGDRPGR